MKSLLHASPGRGTQIAIGIVALGLVIRLYGLGWGLPSVYEEAIPLKTAWGMWNWDRPAGIDLNPHFFNYPTLLIYLHFGAQSVMYGFMKLKGVIGSPVDYEVQYLVDPTSWYIVGRLISTLFALGSIWLTYLLGRRFGGVTTGLLAALFVALNGFHIERSQMIEVDIPLTFGVLLSLWTLIRLMDSATRANYIYAGLAIGIATSAKYTGVMLIIPAVVTHLLARRRAIAKKTYVPPNTLLALLLLVMTFTFLLVSPYVILDFHAFREDIALERTHMSLGHFGLDDASSPLFYSRALVDRVAGWLLTVLGIAGVVIFAFVQRRYAAIVLVAFVIPYAFAVSTWSMHADRYLLPVLPVLTVFAASTVESMTKMTQGLSRSKSFYAITIALVTLLVAIPNVYNAGNRVRAYRSDPRTAAMKWIEANLPSGSYIVTEPYGPGFFPAGMLLQVQPDARQKVLAALSDRPLYPVLLLQMFQIMPEESAVFYDLSLYDNADYVITSSAVRSRYESDVERFPVQNAFYQQLDREFIKMKEFRGDHGVGPTQVVYRNPAHAIPFASRKTVAPPRRLDYSKGRSTGTESRFYFDLGLNFELFTRTLEASHCYELALEKAVRPGLVSILVIRNTSCLVKMGEISEALEFLRTAIVNAPDESTRIQFMQMREQISSTTRRNDT